MTPAPSLTNFGSSVLGAVPFNLGTVSASGHPAPHPSLASASVYEEGGAPTTFVDSALTG